MVPWSEEKCEKFQKIFIHVCLCIAFRGRFEQEDAADPLPPVGYRAAPETRLGALYSGQQQLTRHYGAL